MHTGRGFRRGGGPKLARHHVLHDLKAIGALDERLRRIGFPGPVVVALWAGQLHLGRLLKRKRFAAVAGGANPSGNLWLVLWS